jgi:hypothetical protein
MRDTGADPASRAARAVRIALCREASSSETCEAVAFLAQQTASHRQGSHDDAEAGRAALIDFCHVLLNCNEFAYLN